ncbi:hypothetical protein [Yinghuangia soli]|uniref:Lipoprotein n=1 Tax=Yinghuangia soli TaxID=2908204 RepID=A0AA41Q1H9_9ACTN|nr:hypothetical protein [Yinghuangia soli]MCF2529788.1 hypothetical protein [Yinghuangia soli]
MAIPSRPRRLLAAAATATSLLLAATACGGDDDPKDPPAQGKSTETPAASASQQAPDGKASATPTGGTPTGGTSKALTEDQLEQVVLGKADVPPTVTVESFEQSASEPVPQKAECRPVMDVLSGGIAVKKDEAHVGKRYKIDGDENPLNVIMVASYKPGGAKKLVDEAIAALPKCATFTAEKNGMIATYTAKKAAMESSADTTLAIELTTSAPGLAKPVPTSYLIVRVGDQLAVFVNLDTKEFTSELPDREIVDQQVKKIKDATK